MNVIGMKQFIGVLPLAAALSSVGCGASESADEGLQFGSVGAALIGDALPGSDPEEVEEAAAAFASIEGITDGVGPIFNERACGSCHTGGAMGGSGEQIERRFGRVQGGIFNSQANLGGSLRQLFTVGNFNNPNLPPASRGSCQAGNPTLCCVPQEVEPATATVHNVGRRTTPLFGLGLVDAMPDSWFTTLRNAQPLAVRGTINQVQLLLPDPRDPTQSIGSTRVARFGWKAAIGNLVQFSADAYLNEMAITTQSCINGVSVTAFAIESAPNGVPMPQGCDDLAEAVPPELLPWVPQGTDDAVGSCAGNRTEIQDDVAEFLTFMETLAPPPRDFSDLISINRGDPLFTTIGCSNCHVRTTFVTPANPFNGVPGNFSFNPFSDFLVHDMGALGDRIGNDGQTVAQTRLMRTSPLWGARFNNRFLCSLCAPCNRVEWLAARPPLAHFSCGARVVRP
jgi:CxxC motif-containing protein (DUF1111 family)